jgi:peptidyl-prolyl cis-trans isomerase D
MLESIRRHTASWVVKILLGLLILSFAAWGIGDIFRGPSDTTVAEVGDVEISRAEYGQAYSRERDRIARQFGRALDDEQARQFGLEELTLQRMISRALFDAAAQDLGLTIPDTVLAADIRDTRGFHDTLGRFDPMLYRDVLRQSGYSQAFYELERRRDLRRNQLTDTIETSGYAPAPVVDALFRYREERRVAEIAVFAPDTAPDPGMPDAATLAEYHQQNAARYMAPEYRALDIVALTPEMLVDEVAVSEDEVRQEYESRLDEYVTPARRDLAQIVLPDEQASRDALKRLFDGADFATVAQEAAGLAAADIELGSVTATDLPLDPADAEALFAARDGEFAGPFQSDFGWHVFRVNKVFPKQTRTLVEVGATLRREIALRKAADSLFELANRIEDELAGGASLAEAAARVNVTPATVGAIDRDGRDPAGNAVAGLPAGGDFLKVAFETEAGTESPLTENGQHGYFILHVKSVTAPALRPLDSTRDRVVADWQADRRMAAIETVASEIAAAAGTAPLAEKAAAAGATVRTTGAMTRFGDGADPDVSGALLSKLFEIPVGGIASAPNPQGTAHVVARLAEIRTAEPGADPVALDRLRETVVTSTGDDLLAQYRAALVERFGVTVNRRAIESLF